MQYTRAILKGSRVLFVCCTCPKIKPTACNIFLLLSNLIEALWNSSFGVERVCSQL